MSTKSEDDWGRLADAIVAWSGKDRFAWPRRDETLVVQRFGTEVAAELMPWVHQLANDFFASDVDPAAQDLAAMGESAAAQFRRKHPELRSDAVEALAWCYTFDLR